MTDKFNPEETMRTGEQNPPMDDLMSRSADGTVTEELPAPAKKPFFKLDEIDFDKAYDELMKEVDLKLEEVAPVKEEPVKKKKKTAKREKITTETVEEPAVEEEPVVLPPRQVDFQLDAIDFDEEYERITSAPLTDEETKKKIQQAREEAAWEEKNNERIRRRNQTRWIRAALFILSILTVSLALSWVIMAGVRDIIGFEKNEYYTVELELTEGLTADDIADMFEEHDIISYPWLFKIVLKLDDIGNNFQAGVHEFHPHASYTELVNELQTTPARTDIVEVTIPEGFNLIEIARRLEENGVCKADEFIEVLETTRFDFDFVEDVSRDELKFYRYEGYIFPDKYKFYENDDPKRVAEKFLQNFQNRIKPLLGVMEGKGMTLEETITLASIIQSEAGSNSQMPTISSVFHNRLNHPDSYPHLESDPTYKYVEEIIKPNIDEPNQEMYDAYSTKTCVGLPVGPITNPGLKAIEAALNPSITNYYFFVHNVDTGECFYASTYAQHRANCLKAGITTGI